MKYKWMLCFVCMFFSCAVLKEFKINSPIKEISNINEFIEFDTDEYFFIESSGLAPSNLSNNRFFTHPDSFNKSSFFSFEIVDDKIINYKEYQIDKYINFDFEDICSDEQGNIFIANIGDNWRFRTSKNILCFDEKQLNSKTKNLPYKNIVFSCFDGKKQILTDTEAMFYYDNKFYIISKTLNKSMIFELDPSLYKGKGKAIKVSDFHSYGLVTGADLYKDKYLFVLTYSHVLLFDVSNGFDDLDSNLISITAHHFVGSEGITVSNIGDLLISTEYNKLYVIVNFIKENY